MNIASGSGTKPGQPSRTTITFTPEVNRTFSAHKVFKDAVDRSSTAGASSSSAPPQINSISFDDTGDTCVTAGEDESFIFWDARKGVKRRTFYSKKYGIDLARFTHKAQNILHASTKGGDHAVRYHSAHENKYISYFRGHSARVRSLQMCPINDTFVSAGEDGTVRLWDLRSPQTVGLLHSGGGATLAAIDSSGEVIAVVCSATKVIALFATRELDQGAFHSEDLQDPWLSTISLPPPELVFTSISFSHNGMYILLGTSSDVHFVLDGFDCTVVRRLVGHRGFEYDRATGTKDVQPRRGTSGEEASWTADSRWVISGSSDGKICMWDMTPPPGMEKFPPADVRSTTRPDVVLDAGKESPRCVKANPRYAMLAVGGDELSFWLPARQDGKDAIPEGW